MKRFFSVLFSLLLLIALCAPAFSADTGALAAAEHLHELGLFQGKGTLPDGTPAYALEDRPTRAEALVMLIRLLGEEAAATQCSAETPFTDAGNHWAKRYIAYGYSRGYTNGMTATTFEPETPAAARMYLTFVLRALGYASGDDFAYETVWEKTDALGITDGSYNAATNNAFLRGDVAVISDRALAAAYKGKTTTLLEKLTADGAVAPGQPAAQPDPGETVTYQRVQSAGVTADVLTVNVKNPHVRVETAMVNDSVGAHDSFKNIVANSGGALAVITGNFMNGDSEGNFPVGHVMHNGELLYIGSGFTALGLTADGEARVGRPEIRVRLNPTERDEQQWTAIALNVKEQEQASQFSVLYTPAFGTQFEVTAAGNVTTVREGKVASYENAAPGDVVEIPTDGCVLWLGETYLREFVVGFRAPRPGERVELQYFLYGKDAEGFELDGVTQIVAGAPRLVKNGAVCTDLEPQFSDERFSDGFPSSRTAAGVTADGKLVFVSTGKATIPQLRELMLSLGCMDALNLDGGASTGFYYNGTTYRSPGRPLATTVQIFVD